MEIFGTPRLADIWGIDRNRLQNWIKAGHVAPSVQQATGTGTRNLWSVDDAYALGVFVELIGRGTCLDDAACVLRRLSRLRAEFDLSEYRYLCFWDDFRREFDLSNGVPLKQVSESRTLLVINLAEIKRHVDERAK